MGQRHLQIANMIHKTANSGKAQKERRNEWWTHDIEPLIENKQKAYNKYFKNIEDRER